MEKETVFFLSIWKVFHNLSSQFSIFAIDPKERNINNIENVIQGCGWEGSISSHSNFIHKIEITLWALCVLM